MEHDVFAVVRRQRWLVLAVLVLVVGGTAVLSKALPKVYTSSSTLISLAGAEQTFDSVQAGQSLARSYADIIDSPLLTRLVAERLGRPQDASEIADSMEFEPLTETQLLKVTAEATDPEAARTLAEAYSTVFIDYTRERLSPSTGARVALAVPAQATNQAVRPRPTLYVLLAAILASPLALGLALWRDRVDRRVRTAEDAENRYDLPVLATLPPRGRSARSRAAFFDSVRGLHANLPASSHAGGVAAVSARRREGKTMLVANLALAAAEAGSRVVVIDADLRQPSLHQELMGTSEPLRPGLADYLVGDATTYDVLHETGHDGVLIVPAGIVGDGTDETISERARGRLLVEELSADGDIVLIDTPSIEAGLDALAVSGWVETVLAVVSLERSIGSSTDAALAQLRRVGASVRGLVVTDEKGPERRAHSGRSDRESPDTERLPRRESPAMERAAR